MTYEELLSELDKLGGKCKLQNESHEMLAIKWEPTLVKSLTYVG